jgi:hypothetical protein
MIAFWLRTDHLIAIALFGLFLLPDQFQRFKITNYRATRIYFTYISCAIGLFLLKVYSQNFSFLDERNDSPFLSVLLSFSKAFILYYPKGEGFLWFKFIFLAGIVSSVLLIFETVNSNNRKFTLITLCLFGSFIPYLHFEVQGYIHRFCIHVLPFSLLTIAFFLNWILTFVNKIYTRIFL